MKLLRRFVIAVILAVITIAIWLSIYLGGFKPVEITEAEKGPYKMVYQDHTGSYHTTVQAIEAVEAWAREKKVDCTESFGEYIDDANRVEESRLRSRGGCIVNEIPLPLPPALKIREIPKRKYVMALFEGSPGIGPMKVYPKAESYMRERGQVLDGAVIEIYVIHSEKAMTTTYLFPIADTPRPGTVDPASDLGYPTLEPATTPTDGDVSAASSRSGDGANAPSTTPAPAPSPTKSASPKSTKDKR